MNSNNRVTINIYPNPDMIEIGVHSKLLTKADSLGGMFISDEDNKTIGKTDRLFHQRLLRVVGVKEAHIKRYAMRITREDHMRWQDVVPEIFIILCKKINLAENDVHLVVRDGRPTYDTEYDEFGYMTKKNTVYNPPINFGLPFVIHPFSDADGLEDAVEVAKDRSELVQEEIESAELDRLLGTR